MPGYGRERGGIGGHVIALVDERILVDASIDQANDSAHDIVLPGVLWARVNEAFRVGTPGNHLTINVAGQHLTYIPSDTEIDFHSSPDWGHNQQTDAAVDRIISHLKALGFCPSVD